VPCLGDKGAPRHRVIRLLCLITHRVIGVGDKGALPYHAQGDEGDRGG
jgi:hypothetical protein